MSSSANRPWGRLRAAPTVLALAAAPFLLGGCFLFHNATPTPVRQANLNRESPRATYQYFKTMVANNQWTAEWSVFSPNFKRLLNQSVGRNVDAADYSTARQTIASNSEADMQLLLGSTYVDEQMLGPNAAVVTIESGGQRLTPRLVKLTRWELKVVGDDTPYGDFVASAADAVRIAQDGSITVMIRPPQATAGLLRTFRPEQIEAFRVEAQWYVDDFGGLDETIVQQAGDGAQTPQPRPQPQPAPPYGPGSTPAPRPVYPPRPEVPPQPTTPPTGWGEPDGGRPQGPQDWGSPDG